MRVKLRTHQAHRVAFKNVLNVRFYVYSQYGIHTGLVHVLRLKRLAMKLSGANLLNFAPGVLFLFPHVYNT